MENNKDQTYKIYIQATRQFVEVSEEVFHAFYNACSKERKALMAAGYCRCPRNCIYYCNCDCTNCHFRATPNAPTMQAVSDDGDSVEEFDIPDPVDIEIELDSHLLIELIERLTEIYPDAGTIIKLRYEVYSDSEIARMLNVPRTTFLYKLKSALKWLGVSPDDFR